MSNRSLNEIFFLNCNDSPKMEYKVLHPHILRSKAGRSLQNLLRRWPQTTVSSLATTCSLYFRKLEC